MIRVATGQHDSKLSYGSLEQLRRRAEGCSLYDDCDDELIKLILVNIHILSITDVEAIA